MPRIMEAVLFQARSHEIDDIPDAEMTERFGAHRQPECVLELPRRSRRRLAAQQPCGVQALPKITRDSRFPRVTAPGSRYPQAVIPPADGWPRLKDVFAGARALPADRRPAYLANACG